MATFCELLDAAIKDEEGAVEDYGKLKKEVVEVPRIEKEETLLARFLTEEGIIEQIIIDERKHAEVLKKLKSLVCK